MCLRDLSSGDSWQELLIVPLLHPDNRSCASASPACPRWAAESSWIRSSEGCKALETSPARLGVGPGDREARHRLRVDRGGNRTTCGSWLRSPGTTALRPSELRWLSRWQDLLTGCFGTDTACTASSPRVGRAEAQAIRHAHTMPSAFLRARQLHHILRRS